MLIYQLSVRLPSPNHKNYKDSYSFTMQTPDLFNRIMHWDKDRFKILGEF